MQPARQVLYEAGKYGGIICALHQLKVVEPSTKLAVGFGLRRFCFNSLAEKLREPLMFSYDFFITLLIIIPENNIHLIFAR
jgi:hypothetical protein